MKRITGLIAMVAVAVVSVDRSAVARTPNGAARLGPQPHIFLAGKAHMTVEVALRGAILRLSMPGCQRLLEDFADQGGHALVASLAATGKSPTAAIADLYFVEGDETVQCRADDVVAAFTSPGSRVVHICGRRFIQFATRTRGGEILLIHEFLHTLGLGENPPTSAAITNAVMKRCDATVARERE